MPSPLTDLFAHDGFRTGLASGAVACAVVALVVLVARRPLPLAGLTLAAAFVAGVHQRFGDTNELAVATLVVAAGVLIASGRGLAVQAAAAVPGAVLLARAAELDAAWTAPTVVGVTLVGGALVATFDGTHRQAGLAPGLLAVTALGIYLTTPDTEHSAILLGAAVPISLLGWPKVLAPLGAAGSFAAVGVVGWDVVIDGTGRDGSIVGGLACLGLLVIEPVVRWATRGDMPTWGAPPARDALVAVALHVGVVAVCSRVAGLRASAVEAVTICALAYVAAAVVLVVVSHQPSGRHAAPLR